MAPKKSAAAASSPIVTTGPTTTTTATTTPAATSSSSAKKTDMYSIVNDLAAHYQRTTPQRTKLIDVFLAFIAVVGALQFLYCIAVGNFPFNAFLSGFGATVGQFVLTVSLRIQTTESNKSDFPSVSPERAFADFVVGSLILHFFCINFIN